MEPNQLTPEDRTALRAFFADSRVAGTEGKEAAAAGLAALPRLVKAAYGHDNSQAGLIMQFLSSVYNGDKARPVQLDDIRRLDWSLQKDVAAVILGCGKEGFPDRAIAAAFEAVGGKAAVDALHWFTAGGPQRAALGRLVQFVKENAFSSTAGTVRNALRSIYNGNTILSVHKLTFLGDKLGPDMALVIDGVIGRDAGTIRENDIEAAFRAAGIAAALTADEYPTANAARR